MAEDQDIFFDHFGLRPVLISDPRAQGEMRGGPSALFCCMHAQLQVSDLARGDEQIRSLSKLNCPIGGCPYKDMRVKSGRQRQIELCVAAAARFIDTRPPP